MASLIMCFKQLKNMSVMTVRYRKTLHQTLLLLGRTLSDVRHLFEALTYRYQFFMVGLL